MIEKKANIWSPEFDGLWRVIPINTTLKADDSLVMGAGLAKEAAERYPDLAKRWGDDIKHGYYDEDKNWKAILDTKIRHTLLIGAPTKRRWKDKSDLSLVEKTIEGLHIFFKSNMPEHSSMVCPKLGCGLGSLDWEQEVKPLMLKHFKHNNNFIVVSL